MSKDMSDQYHMIDRFLRNNLDDEDYAEYSAALENVYSIRDADEIESLRRQLADMTTYADKRNTAALDLEQQLATVLKEQEK